MRERVVELRGEDPSPTVLVKAGALAVEARAASDLEAEVLARSLEAYYARFLGKHQHAVVVGAELLERWPHLKRRPVPEEDDLDVARRLIWGMKYVAGSAMDIPEIPLATTDELLAVLREMLDHYGYQHAALWILEARRAYIAGDDGILKELVLRLAPTATRYNHARQCGDCPACVLLQFVEWLGAEATVAEVEEILAPCLGTQPFLPDPPEWKLIGDLLSGPLGSCENADRRVPVYLSRAYLRAGRLGQAQQKAERAMALAETAEAEPKVRALMARTAVAEVMRADDRRALAERLSADAALLEDAYEQLHALVIACQTLGDRRLIPTALALADRLDARVEKKRHVASTKRALGL